MRPLPAARPGRLVLLLLAAGVGALCALAAFERRLPPADLPVAAPDSVPGPDDPGRLSAPTPPSAASAVDRRESAGGSSPAAPIVLEPSGMGPVESDAPAPAGSEFLNPADLEDVEPGFMPTEEGLYALTLGQYLDPGFLEITETEARALLPLDDSIPDWPKNVRALVGDLPSPDDVARGFRDELVRARLADVDALDIVLVDLDLIPLEQRGPGTRELLETLHARRSSACLELCARLEAVTKYPHWSLLQRLREAWAR